MNETLQQVCDDYWHGAGELAVYCRRLGGEEPFLLRDRPMAAASLIKIPIMIEAFRQERAGRISFSARWPVRAAVPGGSFYTLPINTPVTTAVLIEHMIVESDNTCANMLLDILGMAAVNDCIDGLGLKGTRLRRKMMDFTAAAAGRENVTTPGDMGRLMTLLAEGRCLGRRADAAMCGILSRQEDNCVIPAQMARSLRIDHKTGELAGVYHDCGILYAPQGKLILCLMADGIKNEAQAIYDMSYLARALYDAVAAAPVI
ncbi:serine hydrolase [Megasphaera vaginalis (ex Bordigoni et al. 2020)]|uniref:serine hydrolase n=1 Tax=Megasphaera vaginalis (ex Bordigoni et al. 2020) TaxID=2045301 RepID=UPI000C7ACAE2|nr:serine hydrolase [Megasphaera vaginalis (ex Bordigoni et al. 2020)]